MERTSSEGLLQLQQQVVNAVASSTEGMHAATVFLLQLTSHPAFESIVHWLLTGDPAFPPLTIGASRLFPRLLSSAAAPASPEAAAEQQQQREEFTAAAQLVGFNLLLQGVEQQWDSGRWTDGQRQGLKQSVLAAVVGPHIAAAAELPAEAAAAAATAAAAAGSAAFSSEAERRSSGVVPLQTHASRMKCAQVLNAICRYEWPQKWPGLLSCLKSKAACCGHAKPPTGLPLTSPGASPAGAGAAEGALLGAAGAAPPQPLRDEQQRAEDEAFAAACVLLGLVRELSQEAKEDSKTQLTLQRRLQVAQGLSQCVDLILDALSSVLVSYAQHRHARHMQTLVAEVIRELAGVVDVALLLRQQNVLLYLVQEIGKEGRFNECRLQVLQAIDLMTGALSKKKSKRMAVEALNLQDLTVFIHCIVFLADAAAAHAADGKFDPTDAEAFQLELTIADIVKHLCETCADHLMKRVDCVTLSLLWHLAVLPLLAHPSLRIATCGAAASVALVKRMQLATTSQPAVAQQQMVLVQQQFLLLEPSPLDTAVVADPGEAAAQQQQRHQQRQHYLQLLQEHALEQQKQQAFPCWFVLRSYLSLLFLRCLRVGDPALLHLMAVPAFTSLVDDIVVRLLSTAELPAACARAAAAAAADPTTDAAQRLGCVTSPLLRTIGTLPGVRYAQLVRNWYRLMVRYSAADDDLGSEALQGFAARYASMKSSALMPLGVCFSINTYAARRVTTELATLSQLALTHPLFEKRHLLPDVLLRQQLQQLQQQRLREQQGRGGKAGGSALSVLPEKQQPWVCPGYVMLDVCCSFFEAVVQRLKCASLSAAAAASSSGSDGSSSGRSSLNTSPAASQTSSNSSQPTAAAGAAAPGGAAFEWMLPAQAGEAKWATDAATLFSALLELQLFSPQDAAAATAAVDQQRAGAAGGSSATDVVQLCLYNYLLETRRLEFISGCAYFLRYPQVRVEPVLELLFTHILAECAGQGAAGSQESSTASSAAAAAAWSTYPLGVEQQTYLCRRRALYTLISLCTSSPSVLSRFLGMMLQHVQSRLGRYHTQDNERSLLVESLVSLISASQDFAVQQQHTVPLMRPYVEELRLVVVQLQQQDAARAAAGGGASALAGGASVPQVPQQGVALLLFLFGDLQGNVSLPPAEERRLTAQRRALARLLAALESCIKRTCVPADPVAARKGGYITSPATVERSSAAAAENPGGAGASGVGMNAAVEPQEGALGSQQQLLRSFGDSLAELLQSHEAARRQQPQEQQHETGATIGEEFMPRRHPLAALVRDLLPLIFELVAMLHQLWNPEVSRLFPAYASRLMLGEEEFQSLHGHTPLFSDPAALIEAVALTFPVEYDVAAAAAPGSSSASSSSSVSSPSAGGQQLDVLNGVSGGGGGGATAEGVEEQQLSAAGRAYVSSPVRLIRRHCYHLRCVLYRLLGSCCAIPDGFYVFSGLDVLLRKICVNSISFLPLQQLEQQMRLFWIPLLDPINLPPHRIYPSQQLLLFMLQEGVNVVVQRLNREWGLIAESRRGLESSSGTGAVGSAGSGTGSSKEEEKKLNLYTLHVYAAMSLGDTLLALLKNLLHLGKTHHGTAAGAGGDQAGGMASSTPAGAVAARVAAEDDDHSGRGGEAAARDKESATKRADEEAAVAAAAAAAGHLSDMRRAIYSSTPILLSAVNAVLEAQRWPNPATIIEAHSVLRTYVKSATKSFTPIPACTPEVCLHILRGVLSSFFEKRQEAFDHLEREFSLSRGNVTLQKLCRQRNLVSGASAALCCSFDPFSFSDAQQASCCLRGAAAAPQQQFRGSTPLQEFTNGGSGAGASSGCFNADSNVNSQVATYTATVYQVLRAFCRTLSMKVSGAETRKLQPSSLLLCPYSLSAFNFFRAAELPVRLNDEDFERFIEAVMLQDSKEGKAFVKEFLQQNLAVLQQAEGNHQLPRFAIKELKVEQHARLSKLQPSTSCNLGSTFLSSVLQ